MSEADAQELAELRALFELRYAADTRARERWSEEHPEQPLTWPDHADMCVWLLGKIQEFKPAPAIAVHPETLARLIEEGKIEMYLDGARVIVDDPLPRWAREIEESPKGAS